MGDNGDKKQEQAKVILTIEVLPDNSLEIKGSMIQSEPMVIWALEMAKDQIKAFHFQRRMKQQKIVKPHGIMDFVRGKG